MVNRFRLTLVQSISVDSWSDDVGRAWRNRFRLTHGQSISVASGSIDSGGLLVNRCRPSLAQPHGGDTPYQKRGPPGGRPFLALGGHNRCIVAGGKVTNALYTEDNACCRDEIGCFRTEWLYPSLVLSTGLTALRTGVVQCYGYNRYNEPGLRIR